MFEQDLDRYWKTVVSTMQDGIMIVDTGGSIISVNKAFENITGYSHEELIGQKCAILGCSIYEATRERSGNHWCTLFKTGSLEVRRCTLTRKDGSIVHVLKNASPLEDSKGQIIGAVESIADITEVVEKDKQIAAFRRELRSEDTFHGIIGGSAPMRQVFDLIENAAQSDAPVIILGESGTGKELVARAIHLLGERKTGPYVKVNCAALTETLLESELFGHVKGAYTGAYKGREGRFELAQDGDIFLDEIGDVPLSTQVKLLRVLEEKVIERVGDNQPIPVDVRIISATNRNLVNLVEKGSFRKDLYFRINVIPIQLPPLRERVEDIPLLAEAFFRKLCLKSDKNIEGISNNAMEILMKYSWPGNVRELKSAFEYAFVTCHSGSIQSYHLPPDILKDKRALKSVQVPRISKEEMKKRQLIDALAKAKGNQSVAAEILGVSRVTVWNRMKRYGIRYQKKIDSVLTADSKI
ncbi:sigma-54 interaction domain-containing protein [Desulfoferrobacter suflitae]|uniref:sigma-54 interaction domain-containing protein n=1 Tax=Desulfoferrobacter suflitae TaxID=2865782 RepID=UPI002164C340|nr:sigma 54-interacting transcriptional regulator [Desulfoferrobacter suflitae]MCK8603619.1 sigma 54-interacting transcriptional regulator [Desulfoferrobacter suflitae]